MAFPDKYHLDALRKLRGDAFVTYPDGNAAYPQVERVLTVPRGSTPVPLQSTSTDDYSGLKLVAEHVTGGDHQYVELYQTWRTLPGPVMGGPLYSDDERGAVRTTEQIVSSVMKVTGATIAATGNGGTDGSGVTVTGTTGAGTPFQALVVIAGGVITAVSSIPVAGLYTTLPTDTTNEPVTGNGLVGAKLALTVEPTEAGSFAVSGGTATLTHYEPTGTQFLLKKVVEKWAVPGLPKTSYPIDEETGEPYMIESQLVDPNSFVPGVEIVDGTLVEVTEEPSRFGPDLVYQKTVTRGPGTAIDESTAIIKETFPGFPFPGRVSFTTYASGTVVKYKKSRTVHVSHLSYVWFVLSETRPTITVDDYSDTDTVIDGNYTFVNVLHDGFPAGSISATTPSNTEYVALLGTRRTIDGSVREVQKNRWRVEIVKVKVR